jgi:hypothetical protein
MLSYSSSVMENVSAAWNSRSLHSRRLGGVSSGPVRAAILMDRRQDECCGVTLLLGKTGEGDGTVGLLKLR